MSRDVGCQEAGCQKVSVQFEESNTILQRGSAPLKEKFHLAAVPPRMNGDVWFGNNLLFE